MNENERLILPRGNGDQLRVEAMDRVLQSLPLEECTLEQNNVAGVAQFRAPPGKAFRITGENMNVGRIKNSGEIEWPERSNSDQPIPKDPNSLNDFSSWGGDDDQLPEHIATRLTVKTRGVFFGRRTLEDKNKWTPRPSQASSDDVVEIVLLDAPQAWTETYFQAHVWPETNHPMSRWQQELISVPQNVIGMRQSFVSGKSTEVNIELIDLEPTEIAPGHTQDGRVLQIATKRKEDSELTVIHRRGSTLHDTDLQDWNDMDVDQVRKMLWNGRRRITGKNTALEPYKDDPLRDLEFVLADKHTGKVMTPEEAVAEVESDVRFGKMLPHELAEELERLESDPTRFRENTDGYIEPIQHVGSLAVTVSLNTNGDWRMRSGQRRWSPLFGQYQWPDQFERVMSHLASIPLDEAVMRFASPTWRSDDAVNNRKLAKRSRQD